ncbi:MAG: CCA tRNA nucleotidyltransferase [Parvularcula sp.]|jgi:poly(A) polymerase|nr:CCA tRNA nucleotidyltransferase [Parvularcula sp.]
MRTDGRFEWARDPKLLRVLAALRTRGEARFVGGCVRDSLLGKSPLRDDDIDIDIATTLTPPDMLEVLPDAGIRAVPTGAEHGTITAVLEGLTAECTTLRADIETDGRRAEVRFTKDWDEDWRRRDFTINALYADEDGKVWDPAGGLQDLEERRVRFIGDPDLRIEEDALRILRFYRFSARFAERIDEAGLTACRRGANKLGILSKERIWSELSRLFKADRAAVAIAAADSAGVLAEMMVGDAYTEIFAAAHGAGLRDGASSLAALWPGRDQDTLRRAFKPPASVLKTYESIEQARSALAEGASVTVLLYRFGREPSVAAALIIKASGSRSVTDEMIDTLRTRPVPVLPIGGKHLLARGVSPGPSLGQKLSAFEEAWLQADAPTDEERIERLLTDVLGG